MVSNISKVCFHNQFSLRNIFSRQIILTIAALAAISVLEISLSSPLFAVLGFEYSTLMGLALSLICGIAEILRPASNDNNFGFWRAIYLSLLLAFIPLVVSVLSLPLIHNCSLIDGLLFYLEIAFPSAILGSLFGLAFRLFFRNRKITLLSFLAFWIITLFLSLLPGYFNPQLFTYGWQYGFFPGFIWDESLELTNVYLFARTEHLILALLLISLASIWRTSHKSFWSHWSFPLLLLITLITMQALNDKLGITVSHSLLREDLSDALQIKPNCTIHFAHASFTDDEKAKLNNDVRWYLHDIRRRFLLSDTTHPINIYVYPSTESFFDHVGSRVASIAKPWLGEVHITKNNLQSLKHELTHVLLREKGVFPFYASWSTGLTEGAAMSVEPEYDGIYTLDEHAARILQMKYATGVKQVMSFTGFAANASSKSYVLAGSFSRYLLSQYGSDRFDKLYSSLDYEKEYGKPIDSLESEWKRWLAPLMTPMDSGDSAHFRYYYDRSSIVFSPCLRRIGKLQRKASIAYSENRYENAEQLYRDAVIEGAGIDALLNEAYSQILQRKIREAIETLETAKSPSLQKQSASLDLPKADFYSLIGDTLNSIKNYESAEFTKLSSYSFISAYIHCVLDTSDASIIWRDYLSSIINHHGHGAPLYASEKMLHGMAELHKQANGFDRVCLSLDFLRFRLLEQLGYYHDASNLFSNRLDHLEGLNENDSLAIAIMSSEIFELGGTRPFVATPPDHYRKAEKEISDEINDELDFLNGQPH
jgi:hypothetical protein